MIATWLPSYLDTMIAGFLALELLVMWFNGPSPPRSARCSP
jgi:hypothetical protein